MIGYQVQGPAGTRFAGVRLRLVVYPLAELQKLGDERLKVVVQVMDHGKAIAEDPIHCQLMDPLALVADMSQSIREGWQFEPCLITQALIESQDAVKFRALHLPEVKGGAAA